MLQGIKRHINGMRSGIRWMLSDSIIPNLPSRHLRNWGMRKLGMGGEILNSSRDFQCVVHKNLLLKMG